MGRITRLASLSTIALFHICSLTVQLPAARATADTFASGVNSFEVEFVEIGDPGNLADAVTVSFSTTTYGSVDYVYSIGKYEISRDMVTKANTEGDLRITLDDMDIVTNGPRTDMPATGVSWNEAARFVNWLNINQGYSAAYKFAAQPGDVGYHANAIIELWDASDPGFDAANPIRNSMAQYALPRMDEWYKSAYYDANANNGDGSYWFFSTESGTAPVPVASGTDAGTAVYRQETEQGPADIAQAGGLSPFGVMALGGNVSEWIENETNSNSVGEDGSPRRYLRGGDWRHHPIFGNLLASGYSNLSFSSREFSSYGFRVVSIPEPSSLSLGVFALTALTCLHRRTFGTRAKD